MKALIFLVHHGFGGSTIALVPYVQVLTKRQFDVHVVCRRNDLGAKLLQEHGARIVLLPFPMGLNVTAMEEFYPFFDRLLKVFKDVLKVSIGFVLALRYLIKIRPNVVVVGDFSLLQVILASRLLGIKTISLIQTSFSHSKVKRMLIRKVVCLSDAIVGITEPHVQQTLTETGDVRRNRCFVVRNTVLVKDWGRSSFDAFYGRLHITTPNVILFVGGCSRIKGTMEFMNIAVEILYRRNDVSFILAGSFHRHFTTEYAAGTSDNDYEMTREGLHLKQLHDRSGRIKIIGETEYVTPLLEKSRFLLAPSIYPHFLRPVIEAWSVRKPSIVTDDEFAKSIMKDGENGFLVQKGDHAGFVHRCNLLLDDAGLCRRLGESGYQTFAGLYEPRIVTRSIEQMLDAVLK